MHQPPSIDLDIVLPCYRPGPNWAQQVLEHMAQLQVALPNTAIRLILVDDGTPLNHSELDKLRQGLKAFIDVRYDKNMGKGYALRKGVAHSDASYTIYTDVDFPFTTDSMLALYKGLQADKADVLMGIRNQAFYKAMPAGRRSISLSYQWFVRKLLRLPFSDSQCGLKGFNAKGRTCFMRTQINGYLFDLEFLRLAAKDDSIRLAPLPVQLNPQHDFSTMGPTVLLREGANFLKLLFIK